ncbi:MAG: hypothetical protein IJW67_00220 [Blautia sp.]|nr:hypothetical protein [Blautia sp.]
MELSGYQIESDLLENNGKLSDLPGGQRNASDLSENSLKLPDSWHCDIYCRKIRHVSCEGKDGADASASELCPYFDEMLY